MAKDWKEMLIPGALIAAGGVIIYQYLKGQTAEGKLALAESGGRPLEPPAAPGAPAAVPQVPPSGATGTGAGGPGLGALGPKKQANLLMHYRAGDISARQYLQMGGDYGALRRAEDEMAIGYMVPYPVYGAPGPKRQRRRARFVPLFGPPGA